MVIIQQWLRCLRIRHWVKNLLLLIPLFSAHQFGDLTVWLSVTGGMIAFSLVASGSYIINDYRDLAADRSHIVKKRRPLADGTISVRQALIVASILIITGFFGAWFQSPLFFTYIIVYLLTAISYSFLLKKLNLIDVIVLSLLYTIRVLAGAAVTGIELSYWLISFSLFLFLSLGLAKRSSEIIHLEDSTQNSTGIPGRNYLAGDLKGLTIMGLVFGYLAGIILTLYLFSEKMVNLYERPVFLWTGLVVYLFWISHLWHNVTKGKLHGDPIVFALKDKVSYGVLALSILLFFSAGPL